MLKLKIKKGDKVIVVTGKDKGKTGLVSKVDPKTQKVIVNGVNVVKKHTKPSQFNEGGILPKELPIHISNIAHLDPESGKASKVSFRVLDDNNKIRVLKKSGKAVQEEGGL